MIKRILGLLLPTIMLGALQATALPVTQWVSPIPTYLRAACSAVTTDLTTYSWTITTGATDSDRVLVVVGIVSEDFGTTAFGLSSATIETADAPIITQNANASATSTGSAFIQSATSITGAASVDVTATFDEAITAATACVWVVYNLDNVTPFSSRTHEVLVSEASVNLLGFMPNYPAVAFMVCSQSGVATTFTSTGLTEVEDTQGAEFTWTAAEATNAASEGVGVASNALTASCDNSGNVVSASAVAFGNSWPSEVRVRGPDCRALTTDLTTYSMSGDLGVLSGESVLVVAAIAAEDAAATFSVSGVDFDGVAGLEIVDEAGSGVVNTAIYTSDGLITGAQEVTVAATHSEAVTGSIMCIWALSGLTSTTPVTSVADDDTAAGALVLTMTGTKGGINIGICASSAIADTPAWSVTSGNGAMVPVWDDIPIAEFDASAAQGISNGESQAIVCDYDNGNDTSGAAVSFR
jgi:hypothetical protein